LGTIEGCLGTPYQVAGAPVAGTDAVYTITIGGTPTSGTFRLTFDGLVTGLITWSNVNATLVAAVDAALEALASVGTGNVTVAVGTMTAGIGTMTVTAAGTLVKKALPAMTVPENNLVGTSPTIAVATTTPGVDLTGRGCPKGALMIDSTNGLLYQNSGTPAAPTWGKVGVQT
jgi:hypothetical protein